MAQEHETPNKHIVFICCYRGAWGQFAFGGVMVEPSENHFITWMRARGAGRKAFGKKFMYVKGREGRVTV